MHQALKTILAYNHPWPQLTGSASLRPGQLSDDIPARREISRRIGILQRGDTALQPTVDNAPVTAPTASQSISQEPQAAVVSPAAAEPTPSSDNPTVVATVDMQDKMYSPDLMAAVKRFQSW